MAQGTAPLCGRRARVAAVHNGEMSDTVSRSSGAVRSTGRLAAHVYEGIKEQLISGAFAAGSRVSVEEMRASFGVSKQPVMEALRLLSADGLVEIIPQIGCDVASYTLREVGDFYEMFAGFEGAVAAAAAQRRTSDQLHELASASRSIESLVDEPDPAVRARLYRVLNRGFHTAIHAMSASRIMTSTSKRMWDLSDFLINTTGAPTPLASATAERHSDHELIRSAIVAGDAETARTAMAAHIIGTVDVLHAETADLDETPVT
jgi:DNA-binding GntR family transcriptional regulator